MTRHDVWLDVDCAAGLPERDVDDALALIQAFHSPELRVRGVSVVHGNASRDECLPIAREVVGRFGPPGLAVHAGAASAAELGVASAAVRALADALGEGPLTILALGPLTNVATLVRRHPGLQAQITAIVAVAGRRAGQRFRSSPVQREPFPDFNLEQDPAAAAVILDTRVPLVLAPWEVSSQVWLTAVDLAALAAASAAGIWIATRAASWMAFWTRELGAPGFNPFDTLAVTWLTHPALIESMPVTPHLEPGDPPLLLVEPARAGTRTAIYCHRPRPGLKEVVMARLAGPPA